MKKNPALVFILFLFCILIFLFSVLFFYYRGNRNSFINQTINNFSSRHKQLAIELKQLTKILNGFYIFHQFIPSDIPLYSLTIKPQDLIFLNTNLPTGEAYLTKNNKKFVPAEFEYQGKIYKVKVHYRGDNDNHWRFDKKSWRIKFEDSFENQEAIDLILPEDRYFFIEPWIAHMGEKLGLTLPEFSYVNLKVNRQLYGVYLKSEHWGETFLSNHRLSKNADLYGEADFDQGLNNLYADVKNFQKYTFNSSKNKNDVSNLESLLNLLNNSSDADFFNTIPELIDLDNFLRWQAQSTLAFSHSQKNSHNLIIYFNPEINKFQFIPWNVAMADEEPIYPDINYNPLMTRILKNPEYMYQRNLLLWEYVNDPKNLTDDLKYYDDLYQNTRGSFYRDSLKIFPNLDFDLTVKKHRQRIITAQKKILQLLNDAQVTTKLESVTPTTYTLTVISQGFSSITIESIDPQPVNILEKGNQIDLNKILIHTYRNTQTQNKPFLLIPSEKKFTLVFDKPYNHDEISIRFKNAVTDKIIIN